MTAKNPVSDLSADERLSSVKQHYDRGNYRAVRDMLDAIDQSAMGDEARDEFERLEDKVRPDPFARGLAILSFLLFLSVLGLVYIQ